MRARIRGANVARKLVLEIAIHHNSKPVHRAYLEFHASEHVTQYTFTDKTIRDIRSKRIESMNPIRSSNGTAISSFDSSPAAVSDMVLTLMRTSSTTKTEKSSGTPDS
jgi:hypothetical protein